jgi:hypothetical protein
MYAALLTAIVTWISANFALPPDYDHPQLKLVPAWKSRSCAIRLSPRRNGAMC